jgi:hypothetical protein
VIRVDRRGSLLVCCGKVVGQPGGESGPVARAWLSASSSTMVFSSFEKADIGARRAAVGEAGRSRNSRDRPTRWSAGWLGCRSIPDRMSCSYPTDHATPPVERSKTR